MMRCKIGDRAVIVGGIRDNIGHLVDVSARHATLEGWWVVKVLGSCVGRRTANGDLALFPTGTRGAIQDKHLWPLRDGKPR